jgi:tripartite-type tricarboxylate transporter receptor subunit TctC
MLVVAAVACFAGQGARAQVYPAKPVRIVVPFAAGGAVDELARIIGTRLAESFNQPVIIENHAGVGGNLGTEIVARSPPDGYTILQTTNGHAISPALYRRLAFDPEKDFAPVTQLVTSTLVLVAGPKIDARSMRELIALAKAQPGKLNYGSSGVGNPLHLTMEMIKFAAGIEVEPIPYRSDAQINSALMAGDIDVAIVPLATSLPLIAAGRLRALAVTGSARAAALPEVPTIAEAALPGFASSSWQGFFVPVRTPLDIVEQIQQSTASALAAPEIRDKLKALSYEPVGSAPAAFAAFYRSELTKFAEVVARAHIPPQD